MSNPIMLVDAMNLFVRNYVVNPTMSEHGHHVGGTIGFLRSLRVLCEKWKPEKVIVVWEGGGAQKRRQKMGSYKANRKPPKLNRFYGEDIPDSDENRHHQIVTAIKLLRSLPVMQLYVQDTEADDVIGYISRYEYPENEILIVSNDRDFYQLLSHRVTQWSSSKKKLITEEHVKEEFGIPVVNFCTARCFSGDVSDEIKGVKGCGFKTLVRRFPEITKSEFVSVDDIVSISRSKDGSKVKLYKSIVEEEERLKMNWKLMYLGTENLAASQIQVIKERIQSSEISSDKMQLLRDFKEEGLRLSDAINLFSTLQTTLR